MSLKTWRGTGAGVVWILVLSSWACGVEPVDPGGRPCSTTQLCGPGFTCDTATSRCVPAGKKDTGPKDTGPKDTTPDPDKIPKPDKLPPPDTLKPDSFTAPDGGCPTGMVHCGNVCADTTKDAKHCGGCDKACDGKVANKCVAGTCVCGTATASCANGLNCVAGTCKCFKGGLCPGCCEGNVCYSLGSSQSLTRCGAGGEDCRTCKTSTCKTTKCVTGKCDHTSISGGTCSDGLACTHTDTCVAGTCTGTKYSCSDNATCTQDKCTGNTPPYQCNYLIQTGYCAIKTNNATICYTNGTKHSKDPCLKCDTSKSTTKWSAVSGCSSSVTVSTVVTGLNQPRGVAVTSGGVLYIADSYNHLIRRWDGKKLTTLAGSIQGFKNGTGSAAAFYRPQGMALDSKQTALFVADSSNHAIRKVTLTGVVTTVAGLTGTAGLVNGSTKTAKFTYPSGVAVDLAGKLYVTDTNNNAVRLVSGSTVSTLSGGTYGLADGAYATAQFRYPYGIALSETSGALYVTDVSNFRVRRLYAGKVTTLAGSTSGYADGAAATAKFGFVRGIAVGSTGSVYVSDSSNQMIRVISAGSVSTVAGNTVQGYVNGSATAARFRYPYGVALHSSGKIYVADANNNVIRLITLSKAP